MSIEELRLEIKLQGLHRDDIAGVKDSLQAPRVPLYSWKEGGEGKERTVCKQHLQDRRG